VEDALTKTQGEVAAILANNSGLARGAVQAVNAKGLGARGIFIAGADADAANVNYVCQGKQSVEVFKDIQALAETAAQVTADLSVGKALRTKDFRSGVPVVGLPVRLVNQQSVRSVLIESGFHERKLLGSCALDGAP
jgi:D-xylose transport system substrate-binding protein